MIVVGLQIKNMLVCLKDFSVSHVDQETFYECYEEPYTLKQQTIF